MLFSWGNHVFISFQCSLLHLIVLYIFCTSFNIKLNYNIYEYDAFCLSVCYIVFTDVCIRVAIFCYTVSCFLVRMSCVSSILKERSSLKNLNTTFNFHTNAVSTHTSLFQMLHIVRISQISEINVRTQTQILFRTFVNGWNCLMSSHLRVRDKSFLNVLPPLVSRHHASRCRGNQKIVFITI